MSEPLAEQFHAYARRAIAAATETRDASEALRWARSGHEALMAAALVNEQPMDDDERAALATIVAEQRRQIAGCGEALAEARTERDGLARLLHTLAGEFESASTPTAARLAERIRRTLRDVAPDEEDEPR